MCLTDPSKREAKEAGRGIGKRGVEIAFGSF
jgi:hypothetical protein